MTTTSAESTQELRQRAEEKSRMNEGTTSKPLSLEETKQLLHELRVHQIELEMQNEQLRCAYMELDALQSSYFDLYDLAPVGYLTIDESGLIKEANLAAATMLGVDRSMLIKHLINRIIFKDDQDMYYLRQKKDHDSSTPSIYEMRLVRVDASQFWVNLQVTAARNDH